MTQLSMFGPDPATHPFAPLGNSKHCSYSEGFPAGRRCEKTARDAVHGGALPAAKMPYDEDAAGTALLRSKATHCTAEGCGALIVFPFVSRKIRGSDREQMRPMPVDLEPDPAGTVHVWVESKGRVLRGHVFGRAKDRAGRQDLHRSHFATCPGAGQFRQRSD